MATSVLFPSVEIYGDGLFPGLFNVPRHAGDVATPEEAIVAALRVEAGIEDIHNPAAIRQAADALASRGEQAYVVIVVNVSDDKANQAAVARVRPIGLDEGLTPGWEIEPLSYEDLQEAAASSGTFAP